MHRSGWLVAALVFVTLRALPNISYPIGRDQATYCLIGQGLLDGQQLYRDLWDNKPPGIFYIFTAIIKAFGPVMWSVGVVDILWLLCISYFIFRFAERYLGPAGAFVAVVFNASWHVGAGYWDAAQPESILTLLVFVSFSLMQRGGRWGRLFHFAAGIVFAAAFWIKYNSLAFLPFVLVIPYLDAHRVDERPHHRCWTLPGKQWLVRASVFAGAFAMVSAIVLVYFRLEGAWPAFRQVQFEVLPRYSEMALTRTPHLWRWVAHHTRLNLGLWTEGATLLALLIAWRLGDLTRFTPIFLSAAMGYAAMAMQFRFSSYTFETCFPFFAMIWGYLAVKLWEGIRAASGHFAARRWHLARVLVWIAFADVVFWPIPGEFDSLRAHYEGLREWRLNPEVFYANYPWPDYISHFSDQMRVIRYLNENLASSDTVFVWGSEPLVYFLTGRRPPTRFLSNLPLISPWGPRPWRQELMYDLGKSPPRFLVVVRHDKVPFISYKNLDSEQFLETFPELAAFIKRGYGPDLNLESYAVYRRRESSAAGDRLRSPFGASAERGIGSP
jgi:hypothetical protein